MVKFLLICGAEEGGDRNSCYICLMEPRNFKLLVVDDEAGIREGLRDYLALEGYNVDAVESAEKAIEAGIANYDLLLLDVMMDGMGGFELARRMKRDKATAAIPVIFLTARDADDDVVEGLGIGADDYIAKPFSMRVLVARIATVLRRFDKTGGVECDRVSLVCTVDGAEVRLPRKEFELLAFMLENRGRIFRREELLRQVWPENVVVVDRSVDVHITRIRSKLGPYARNIVSRSGYGYGWQD